ncbi:MAG: hypothetical protein H7259_05600 [Cytophagales bacterium]|nr:hypothetical protein [Cytophaga sp.]
MVRTPNLYRLIICIALLLFTQVVMPYMHHHAERHYSHGIAEAQDDTCLICALDIVPADFIPPSVFCFVCLAFVFLFRNSNIIPQAFYALLQSKSRAPPVC